MPRTADRSRDIVAGVALVSTSSLLAALVYYVLNRRCCCNTEQCDAASSDAMESSRRRRVTTRDTSDMDPDQPQDLVTRPIGVVRSIYRLCVGTPRQGLLAPQARGRIELFHLDMDAVDELEHFSHIWIIFHFHLNTSGRKDARKIAPPALGGKKIGVLASRSPHRPNPIGMTLCRLDGIRVEHRVTQKQRKPRRVVCLQISGIDLVDGTPVLDIKPHVPLYDAPPDHQYRLPSWVSQGLATQRPVTVSEVAHQQLDDILRHDSGALDFYQGPTALTDMLQCIQQVLSMDVRSSYQTLKARQGKSQAQRAKRIQELSVDPSPMESASETCTQQLDNLLIHFTVTPADATALATSHGSGAEDPVLVTAIELLRRIDRS